MNQGTVVGVDLATPGSIDHGAVVIGQIDNFRLYVTQHGVITGPPQLTYDSDLGLRRVRGLPGVLTLGTYHRLHGRWRQRIKRKTSGHTWKWVDKEQLPKKLKMEALLLGVEL